jgi:hypothetical protein
VCVCVREREREREREIREREVQTAPVPRDSPAGRSPTCGPRSTARASGSTEVGGRGVLYTASGVLRAAAPPCAPRGRRRRAELPQRLRGVYKIAPWDKVLACVRVMSKRE